MIAALRVTRKISLAALLTLVLFVPIWLAWLLHADGIRARMVKWFYGCLAWISGLRISLKGELLQRGPALLVANHCGYADVFVLGSLTRARFTPKSEVRSWPVIGFFCELAGCVFVQRQRSKIAQVQQEIAQRIAQRAIMCIFPEGTTNTGERLLPFKSGLFSLAEQAGADLPVQPVAIIYTHMNGKPATPERLQHVAWVGEIAFVPHLMQWLALKEIRAEVVAFEPVRADQFASRKELCRHAEGQIGDVLHMRMKELGYDPR